MILKFLALFFFLSPAWGQSHWRSQVLTLPASPVVLLGEQHDASEHQELAKLNLALLMRSIASLPWHWKWWMRVSAPEILIRRRMKRQSAMF